MTPQRPPRLRYFTPTEATVALRRVLPIVEQALDALHTMRDLKERLEGNEPLSEESRVAVADEIARQRERLHTQIEEITDLGVEVNTLDPPSLRFPAMRSGLEVALWWKAGDRAVAWWAHRSSPPTERQPIADPASGVWEWLN